MHLCFSLKNRTCVSLNTPYLLCLIKNGLRHKRGRTKASTWNHISWSCLIIVVQFLIGAPVESKHERSLLNCFVNRSHQPVQIRISVIFCQISTRLLPHPPTGCELTGVKRLKWEHQLDWLTIMWLRCLPSLEKSVSLEKYSWGSKPFLLPVSWYTHVWNRQHGSE